MIMTLFGEIVFLAVCASVLGTNPVTVFEADGKYRMEIADNVSLMFYGQNGSSVVLNAQHTSSVFKTDGPFKRCVMGRDERNVCVNWGAHIVNVSVVSETCLQVETSQPGGNGELSVCFPYGDVDWFGGPSLYNQSWPVQLVQMDDTPLVTGYKSGQHFVESLWFNAKGVSIYAFPDVPLFWESNQNGEKKLCLKARDSKPYLPRNSTVLRYEICTAKNAVEIQRAAVERYFQKPAVCTNASIFQGLGYSTRERSGQNLEEDMLYQLVTEISQHDYPIGTIDIEDKWESCYGSMEIDTFRFPNFSEVMKRIHNFGGKISAWAHPFVSEKCQQFYNKSLSENRFVHGEDIKKNLRDRENISVVDLSKNDVATWWAGNVQSERERYEFDVLKFDNGQSNFLPSLPQLTGNKNNTPDFFVKKYAEIASLIPGVHEISFGRSTQNFPGFVRMPSKDSHWGLDNGLPTVLTTLFQMNLAGYPFVIADYVGGKGQNQSKELFIRWMQAVTFIPRIQFSILPWDFDTETVEISRQLLALHNSYANLFQSAAEKALSDGTPINTPIWWIAPDDPIALNCTDEYLLAERILVAPILKQGETVRQVYLPQGTWYNSEVGTIKGPKTLRVQAPLNTLIYFVKDYLKMTKE